MAAWQIQQTNGSITFRVRVIPRARKTEIVGLLGEELKVRLAAPPVEGAANRELVRFLARQLGVRRSQVRITAGESARSKVIAIEGFDATALQRELQPYL